MGRNTNPQLTPVVPINGAVYRNSSNNGLIIDATGAQYLPSNGAALLTNADYAKYIALNSATPAAYNVNINSAASKNFGTVVPSSPAYNVSQYTPYIDATVMYAYYPFCGRTGKNRITGMSGTNGTNTLVFQNPPGYTQNASSGLGAAVYNATTGALVSVPTYYPIAGWYDSSTSLFRVIASPTSGAGSSAVLLTSSTGATWTTTSISYSITSGFQFNAFGGPSYYPSAAAVASGQKLFVTMRDTNGSNQTCLFRSTNGGATITEVTTAVTTSAAYYTPAGNSNVYMAFNYDGTTLFVPANSRWCYSTNDGTSFTASTITGVTTSADQNPTGVFSAGNLSSSFMMVYNSRVTSNRIFVTTNGGQSFTTYSWTPAGTLNTSNNQTPGDYDSANSRWAFVYGTSVGWYVAVSTNNGSTWTHNLVQGVSQDESVMNIVFLGGVWYVWGSIGIWKSTDAATWTNVTTSNPIITYGQPYMELTDYVLIGSRVIKKSDFSVTTFNAQAIISNQNGYNKTFVNYLGSDAIIQVQTQYTTFPLLVTSATASTANNFSPYPYSNQQSGQGGINPTTIEYWRIK